MSRRRRIFICLAIAIVILFALVAWFLTWGASHAHRLADDVLSPALASARSVTVSEHIPYAVSDYKSGEEKELVPHSVALSPDQIAELARSVAGHFDYGQPKVPLCFQPPFHRIEIVLADGALRRFDVSFYCGIFTYEGHRYPLPRLLSAHLRECFTQLGIPPRSDDAYIALENKAAGR